MIAMTTSSSISVKALLPLRPKRSLSFEVPQSMNIPTRDRALHTTCPLPRLRTRHRLSNGIEKGFVVVYGITTR